MLRHYERWYPVEAHIMRWHLDQALESYERINLVGAETLVLHSDFATWNLLFEGEKLTGGYRLRDDPLKLSSHRLCVVLARRSR